MHRTGMVNVPGREPTATGTPTTPGSQIDETPNDSEKQGDDSAEFVVCVLPGTPVEKAPDQQGHDDEPGHTRELE